MKKIILGIFFISIFSQLFAGEMSEKMSALSKTYSNLYLEFTQERNIDLLEEISISKGFILFDSQGKMRWEISEPFKSLMIYDGENESSFEFENNKWKALKQENKRIGKMLEQIRHLVMGDYSDNAYTIKEENECIVLVPVSDTVKKFISEIIIKSREDFSAPEYIKINFPNGDSAFIKFEKVLVNLKDCGSAFDLINVKDFKID